MLIARWSNSTHARLSCSGSASRNSGDSASCARTICGGDVRPVVETPMKLELTDDQALVLFEWLSRLDEHNEFPVEDPAEEQVLWSLHGQLEKALTEPFRPDYRELVQQDRERVKASFGAG